MQTDGLKRVLAEHSEGAGHLLGMMQAAPRLFQSCRAFDNLCNRCEANLDALRIAGDEGLAIGQGAMEDDPEAAGVVAILLAESTTNRPESGRRAVELLDHESPEIRQAAWRGLRLAKSGNLEAPLRDLVAEGAWTFPSAAALDILAFHRLGAEWTLEGLPEEDGDDLAWLLAEAGGRIPGVWESRHLTMVLGHASPRVREAALRASARSGLAGLPQVCREAAERMKPEDSEAISFLGVVGAAEDIPRLQRVLRDDGVAVAGIQALGRLGLPAGVPILLASLGSETLAEPAAKAIWRITGQKVPRGKPPDPPAGMSEDDLDFWEPVAPVDADATDLWWRSQQAGFDPNKRYQAGLCVSDDPLGAVFDELPMAIRYDVYLRERTLTPGTPDWELETWCWQQRDPGSQPADR